MKIQAIIENPYLQYFIGLHEFQEKAPFDASSMTYFRKRFDTDLINDINERIVQKQQEKESEKSSKNEPPNKGGGSSGTTSEDSSPSKAEKKETNNHQGKLLLDATCAPSDIAYPTDISLLNQAREKLEGIIDTFHAPLAGKQKKLRTYRKKARKQYLAISKQRSPSKKKHTGDSSTIRLCSSQLKTYRNTRIERWPPSLKQKAVS